MALSIETNNTHFFAVFWHYLHLFCILSFIFSEVILADQNIFRKDIFYSKLDSPDFKDIELLNWVVLQILSSIIYHLAVFWVF